MAEIKFYTPEGFKALQDELDYLLTVRVEENKKEISTARSFGDLSENSEYDEAKAEQGKIHARIAELREMIANAKVLDESEIDKSRVSVGSIVVRTGKSAAFEVCIVIPAVEDISVTSRCSGKSDRLCAGNTINCRSTVGFKGVGNFLTGKAPKNHMVIGRIVSIPSGHPS